MKHLRTLLPDRSVDCSLPVIVPAVWVRTTLQQLANHLCHDDVSSVFTGSEDITHLRLAGVHGKEKSI